MTRPTPANETGKLTRPTYTRQGASLNRLFTPASLRTNLLCLLGLAAPFAWADADRLAPADLPEPSSEPAVGTVRIYSENDGSLHDPFDGYDRHYTSGFAVVLEHQPDWAKDLADNMPLGDLFARHHGSPKTGAGYLLSQLIFTPNNLRATAPIPGDQPYAGYLYTGAFWQRQGDYYQRDDIAVLDHFELNVGVVGENSLGQDIQDWVHESFEGVTPRGWDNQLANEVTFQAFYRRKWRVDLGEVESSLLGPLQMQAIPQAGVALGTVYRHAEAATTFRIGQNLPDDFGPGRINDLQSSTGDPFAFDSWSWYVFTRAGGRLVEHDLFLDGSNNDSSLSVSKNSAVGEVQGGLAVGYRPNINHRFDLSWGVTYHTDTFDGAGASGTESYGTFVLSWLMSF